MWKLVVGALFIVGLSGCASIVSGTSQSVTVEPHQGPKMVQGVTCKLVNSKGEWYSQAPGSVVIHKAYGPLTITCDKQGLPTGVAVYESSTVGMAAGNILFGGVIGVGVDVASGAAYEYPNFMRVEMGQTLTFGKAKPADTVPRDPTSAANANQATVASSQPVVPVQPLPPIQAAAPQPVGVAAPVPTPASVQYSPVMASATPQPPGHRFQMAAEQLARDNSCSSSPSATLKMSGPDMEIYSLDCASGDKELIRCEAGAQCHVMQ